MEESSQSHDAAPGSINGRMAGGLFAPGNKFSKGSPWLAEWNKRRAQMFKAVKDTDIELCFKTWREIMEDAEAPRREKIAAAIALYDRACGSPSPVGEIAAQCESANALEIIRAEIDAVKAERARGSNWLGA